MKSATKELKILNLFSTEKFESDMLVKARNFSLL